MHTLIPSSNSRSQHMGNLDEKQTGVINLHLWRSGAQLCGSYQLSKLRGAEIGEAKTKGG